MAVTELFGSLTSTVSARGVTARRLFLCLWGEQNTSDDLPKLGDQYPNTDYALRCVSIEYTPEGQSAATGIGDTIGAYTHCRISYEYAMLEGPDDLPSFDYDIVPEMSEVGGKRTWESTGAEITQPLNATFPILVWRVTGVKDELPVADYLAYMGKLNNKTWMGVESGKARFDGFTSRTEWNPELAKWRHRIQLTFSISPRGHKYIWNKDSGAWDRPNQSVYDNADFNAFFVWET